MLNFYSGIKNRQWSLLIPTLVNHIWSYPTPLSLNLNYSAGSLAGMALVIQILSGLFLTMHYIPAVDFAFESVEHIMRDVRGGSMIRYVHANGASFFFFTVYWHMGRSMYYRTYVKNVLAWNIGVVIFFALMAVAFIGYVLPWGQMSFWGATVITNLFSVIPVVGQDIVYWLWGGFGVAAPTLNRFYTLHFLLPFVVLALVILHLMALHGEGSSTPQLGHHAVENNSFGGYFILKDLLGVLFFFIVFGLFLLFAPNALNHPDNYIPANPMQTPAHIVPEWYFLPFYAILRTVPNKQLGVVAMGGSILFLFLLPHVGVVGGVVDMAGGHLIHIIFFWGFVYTTIMLGYLGGQPISYPYTQLSLILTVTYFAYIPLLSFTTASVTRSN